MSGQSRIVGVDHQMSHQLAQPLAGQRDDDPGEQRCEASARAKHEPIQKPHEAGPAAQRGEDLRGHVDILGAGHLIHEADGHGQAFCIGEETGQLASRGAFLPCLLPVSSFLPR